MSDVKELIERMHALSKHILSEDVMEQWDTIRGMIAGGNTSSGPRDIFESILDNFAEECNDIATALTALLTERASLLAQAEKAGEVMREIIRTNQVREFMGSDASDGYGNEGWVVRDGQYARAARQWMEAKGHD